MWTFLKNLLIALAALITSIIILIVAIAAAAVVGVNMMVPSEQVTLRQGTLLEINLATEVVDSPDTSPLGGLLTMIGEQPLSTSLFSALRAIECAADDPNITAVSLRMDGSYDLSIDHASEIREALIAFKERSSKPIYSYSEGYTQSSYYLASVADSVFVNPMGSITWQGVAIDGIYYGGLLKAAGVKAEVFRPEGCDYKSAVEPFTSSSMSAQSREQNQRLVDNIWGNIVDQVADSRDINIGTLFRLASDRIIIEPEEALTTGMANSIAYRDQYDRAIERLGVVRRKGSGALRTVTMERYASNIDVITQDLDDTSDDKIALIYANGTIYDGDAATPQRNVLISGVLARQLRRARYDDDVEAVVVRVNSPGGSALAAEVIWREMELLRAEKPVVVSIGGYGASGGYYISAPADIILVNRFTIGGSIGVYGVMYDCEQALSDHLHITFDGTESNPSANFGRLPRSITPTERAAMMRGVDSVYDTFRRHVAEGRHLSMSDIDRLSGGRVWSGEEMVRNRLADGEGGLRQAIAIARERSGANQEAEIEEYVDFDSSITSLFSNGLGARSLLSVVLGDDSLFSRVGRDIGVTLGQESGVVMQAHERLSF